LILNGAAPITVALADGESGKADYPRPSGLPTPASPLGVAESLVAFKVNGSPAYGRETIWRNDLVQAPNKASARVSLESLGKATLDPGSVVRFTTVEGGTENSAMRRRLHIQLTAGGMSLTLNPEAGAYLEAPDGVFIASPGARLRFGLRENRAFVDLLSGDAEDLGAKGIYSMAALFASARPSGPRAQQAMQSYRIKPVGGQNNSAIFDVRARATRQVQVQVTDDRDRPVPDIPIIFGLGSNIGRFSGATATTNEQGIASVNLTAGDQETTSDFTATIQGTNISLVGQIVVLKALPAFWTPQNAGPVFGVVAAAVTAATVTLVTKQDPLQVKAVGAPVIKP
jgi:ribosomal protein S12